MRTVFAIAVVVGLAACDSTYPDALEAPCTSDEECGEGNLCFPEGCGNPGKNIALEVVINSRTGHHAQDFLVPDLKSVQNVEVFGPTSVKGELQRLTGPTGQVSPTLLPYSGAVTVRAIGESLIIPGITRRYETTILAPERGAYAMFLGVGKYTLTAIPAETGIPSDSHEETFLPGEARNVDFVFPSLEGALSISGRLLKTYSPGPPPLENPITQAVMEIQALDPNTRRALSQRAPVSSGFLGSKGDFTLAIDPSAAAMETLLLVATPVDATAKVPSKTFVLQQPFPQHVNLEMGDFGEVIPVTGRVQTTLGAPIAKAALYVVGKVAGDGVYRSRTVLTEADGSFRLETLPSAPGTSFTLTVSPPDTSSSGLLRTAAQVSTGIDLSPTLSPSTLICPNRIQLQGTVTHADGRPASGVKVVADPLEPLVGSPLPPTSEEAYSDAEGRFSLRLDPALYRLDFLPGSGLPRRSRQVTVAPAEAPIELSPFALSKGRSVTGVVSAATSASLSSTAPAANATLRFFRVSSISGKPSAILLGEAITDERGSYSLVLPTR